MLQSVEPLITNDQWGLLKVLLFFVGPVIIAMWGIERRKEKHDITNLGRKIDEHEKSTSERMAKFETELKSIAEKQSADKLEFIQLINGLDNRMQQRQSTMQDTLSRLDERWDIVALLKAVIREEKK